MFRYQNHFYLRYPDIIIKMSTTQINYIEEVDDGDNFENGTVADQVLFLREYITDHPATALELFSHFDRKYRASGVESLACFLESVCVTDGFSGAVKLMAANALLSFQNELEEESEPHLQIKIDANINVVARNKKRISRGVFCLTHIIEDIESSILRFDCILRLYDLGKMEDNCDEIREKCDRFMKNLIGDHRILAQYRLRLLTKIPIQPLACDCFIYFLGDPGNPTSMRILAAQAALVTDKDIPSKSSLYDVVLAQVEIFARDEELDDFIRADAADVLLGHGDEDLQKQARNLIRTLGRRAGFGLYENAQNVHAESVDESIRASLDTLGTWKKENESKVQSFEDTAEQVRIRRNLDDQTLEESRDVETALLRICMGSRTYGGFTSALLFCTVCAWIGDQEDQDELWTRFDQELLDMVNTCTTGVVSRLINVLSGWGGFQIKISFKDQIKSNFAGRLNAIARTLMETADDGNHEFYETRKESLTLVYITDALKEEEVEEEDNTALLAAMADRELDKVPVPRTFEQTVKSSRSSKIDALILTVPNLHALAREHFSDRLLLEFSSAEPNRKCFNLFFGYCFSKVREELREEFKTFVSPDDFEMCVRDALAFYEGA